MDGDPLPSSAPDGPPELPPPRPLSSAAAALLPAPALSSVVRSSRQNVKEGGVGGHPPPHEDEVRTGLREEPSHYRLGIVTVRSRLLDEYLVRSLEVAGEGYGRTLLVGRHASGGGVDVGGGCRGR